MWIYYKQRSTFLFSFSKCCGMSTSGNGNEKPVYEAPLSTEEVYCVLLHQLGVESEKLKDHGKKAENTPDIDAWKDVRNGSDASESLQKLKGVVIKALKEKIENHQAASFCSVDGFLEEKVTCSFKEHTNRNEDVIKYLEDQIKSVQKLTTLLSNQAEDLATNLTEKKAKEAMSEEQLRAEFRRKEELLLRKHRKLVRGVRSVTAEMYPRGHRELDNILGILLNKYFTPDAYVDEEEGWEELVEFLFRAEMVTRHPDQPRKIRLVDFM